MVKPPLLVATRSLGKQPEIKAILADLPYRCVFPDEVGIYERTEEDKLEDADSFSANAYRKAEYFALKGRIPTAADDSGIEVFSLGGKPGVKSKRFAMPSPNQEKANNEELLRRLSGAPREKRKARYRCCVSYLKTPDSVPMNFEGVCTGHILEEPEGDAGFGYDPIFWSDDLDMSFGKASPEDKHAVSHRGRAFRAFAEWLMQQK